MRQVRMRVFMVAAVIAMILGSCKKEELAPSVQVDEGYEALENGKVIEGKYIVVFHRNALSVLKSSMSYPDKRDYLKSEIQGFVRAKGLEAVEIDQVYVETFYGFSGKLAKDQLNELGNDNKVAFIEKDRIIALGKPPWAGGGDGGNESSGQEIPWGIERVGYGSGSGKTAWILDTGIDLDHPDLNVDQARAFSVFNSGKDASADDLHGHGSHVAGTIAALDNDQGVIGVAGGALVVPVKVLDRRGSGTYSGVIAGVDYVAANGNPGDVANMSLGGPASSALDLAVVNAASNGIKFTIAAGNDGEHADNQSPARVNAANVYTISAMDSNDRLASFSNFGNPPVDYSAPGVSIKSSWKDGGYNSISGTSMAAPHAAGVLLLGPPGSDGVVSGDPDGTPDIIIHR